MPGDIEKEIDRLYGLPLEHFTTARNELARSLSKEKRRAESGRVKDLRKPTVPAWLINQLSRREKMLVRSLLEATDRIQRAQEQVLARGSPERLHAETENQREAIVSLVEAAERVPGEERRPLPQAVRDRIGRTLRAAAVDEQGRELLKAGRLTGDLDPSGFGPLLSVRGGQTPKTSQREQARRKRERERESATKRELEARVREARNALRQAEGESKSAQLAWQAKERLVDRARRELEDAVAASKRSRGGK